jgi:hypothetical protein
MQRNLRKEVMVRRVRLLLVAALLATALVTVAAPSASAVPGGCSSGALCVYWNVNYDNGPWRFFGTNDSWGAWAIEDDDSSWFNNGTSGRSARVWVNRGRTWPVEVCLDRGDGDAYAIAIDDRGSSNDWPWGC